VTTKITLVKNPHSTLPRAFTVIEDPNLPPHVLVLRTENHEVVIDAKSGTLHKRKRVKFEALPDYGDHMTWRRFCELIVEGCINDEDGCGTYATTTQVSNIDLSMDSLTSKIFRKGEAGADAIAKQLKPPHDWVTHVVWFNK
jgi:hypothetical protein